MRKSVLLTLLALACSGDDGPSPGYWLIPDFLTRSPPLACQPVAAGDLAVGKLHTASDSTVVVLDPARRRIAELDHRLQPLWSLEYSEHGPAAVDRPVDVALLGDTAVAVAARGGLRLVILDRAGGLIHAEPLAFIPNAIADGRRGDVLITATPLGSSPATLLFRYRAGTLEPVGVPPRNYQDMTVGALANAALVESLPDGSALLIHQLLTPRAFRVAPGLGAATPVPVPTPDATRDLIGFVPHAPVTEDQFARILTPALALSVDRGRGDLYLLTRSGRQVNGRAERAVLRLDSELRYVASYTLDVHAVEMAALPARSALLVADDEDRIFLCSSHAETRGE